MTPTNPAILLAGTTLLASVLGSLHCAGMCGALVAFTAGFGDEKRPSLAATQTAYHGGRLLSYVALGAIAGALGAALNLGGGLVGVQRIASLLAGLTIALVGAATLFRMSGARMPRMPVPGFLLTIVRGVHRRAFDLSPLRRALVIGLVTPLLPCGWLYAFAAVAAGAGGPLAGALVMAAFWMGTVPALAAVAAGVRVAAGRLGRALPIIAGTVMVAAGLHVALVRGPLASQVAAFTTTRIADSSDSASDEETALGRVDAAENEIPACCREDEAARAAEEARDAKP
ncbi:MAG: sulfite exporter TauE/SafE family protein [Phycisphaerae bacterium]|nr:sulfite exporter TauE/SafE family protein [Phycisphaerae bacterium]